MRFTTFVLVALAIAVLFAAFAPQESMASKRKILRKVKKLAALAILAKPKKLLALPLPLPIPIPIPIIKKVESWPSWQPSWPAPAASWPAPSWPAEHVESWPAPSWDSSPSWA